MPAIETLQIVSRIFDGTWKIETVEFTGTLEQAWKEASRIATAFDSTGNDSWTVDLKDGRSSIVQLFPGRLI